MRHRPPLHIHRAARFAALALAAAGAALPVQATPMPRAEPVDPRVRVQVHEPDRVIDVPVQRGVLTHLVLPAGETLAMPPATGLGARCDDETHAWCIVHQGRDLFIRAKPAARTNNLIVVTDRHRYAFDLRVVDKGGLMRLTLQAPGGTEAGAAVKVKAATPADLQERLRQRLDAVAMPRNSQYTVAVGGKSEDIVPVMVFDDGRFTYFRFPANRPVPAVFQTGADGHEETVNVRMAEDDLLVADRVARRFVLRLGQAVVAVVNEAFDLDGEAPRDGTTMPGISRVVRTVPTPVTAAPAPRSPAAAPAPSLAPVVASREAP